MARIIFYRGDIHWVEFPTQLTGTKIHTIQAQHPAVIISNNQQNQFSPVLTVLPITSQLDKIYPFEVLIQLEKPSKILLDQITTIDKTFAKKKIASLTDLEMTKVEKLLHSTLALRCYQK